MKHFVYIVECSDSTLYTGYTLDVVRRVHEHNKTKKGAKSLKRKLPVKLVYKEEHVSVGDALRREKEIKRWPRLKKLALVNNTRG